MPMFSCRRGSGSSYRSIRQYLHGGTAAVGADGNGTCCSSICGCSGDRHQCLPRCVVERYGGSASVVSGCGIGGGSSDAAAEAATSTGGTAAPVASAARAARAPTSAAGSAGDSWVGNINGERGASTHSFDPGTVFPLEVRYSSDERARYNGSWLQHGSSSSSNSRSDGSSSSSSSSNDNTSDNDSWWDAT